MNIHCPNCRYERSIDEAKLPASACMATCPKCACRFKFRDLHQTEDTITPPSETTSASVPPMPETHIAAPEIHESAEVHSEPQSTAQALSEEKSAVQNSLKGFKGVKTLEANELQNTPVPAPSQPEVQAEDKIETPAHINEATNDGASKEGKKDIWDDISTTVNRWQDPSSQAHQDAKMHASNAHGQQADAHGVPWEHLDQYGFLQGLMLTIKQASLAPSAFFGKLIPSTQATRPLSFFVLLGVFQAIMERLWYITTFNTLSNTLSDPHLQNVLSSVTHDTNFFVTLLVSPFLLTLQVFIISGLYYLMFRFVRPEKADFTLIFRVICYAAAPTIICVVPFFGSVFASFIFLIWTVIGCKHALHMPWSRALMAVAPLYLLALAGILQVIKTLLLSIPT